MDADPLSIILLVLFFLLYVYYTAADSAFDAFSDSKMERLANSGKKKAEKLLSLTEERKTYLPALTAGRFFFALSFGSVASIVFATKLSFLVQSTPSEAVLVQMSLLCAFMSGLLLWLFGELVARRAALRQPEQTALGAYSAVSFLRILLFPFIGITQLFSRGILRLIGINPNEEASEVTEEEILNLVDIGEEAGAIEATEKEMIENVFEFNNTTAEDIMVHRTNIDAIWIGDGADEILKLIAETGHSRFPVYDESLDDIKGILNAKRFLLNLRAENPKPLTELITPPFFVPELVKADALFREMQAKKFHIAIVVDEYGGTGGLLTMEDLIEEIVGNIYDEFDEQPSPEIIPQGDNLWRISGQASLEEVAEALSLRIPEENDFETLGGLIFSGLTTIPADGEKPIVDAMGMHIEVTEIVDRRVEWANVSLLASEENEEKSDTEN
ncbi:MAG: HlyC/CorC family transporter [Clostridia bacterium]|nr:HlyC/CorC family transporter [Clostridia bacterium]